MIMGKGFLGFLWGPHTSLGWGTESGTELIRGYAWKKSDQAYHTCFLRFVLNVGMAGWAGSEHDDKRRFRPARIGGETSSSSSLSSVRDSSSRGTGDEEHEESEEGQ